MTNRKGIKGFQDWMRFVQKLGWPRSTWKRLADLWWEHHDENGSPRKADGEA